MEFNLGYTVLATALLFGVALTACNNPSTVQDTEKVFEMRTYTTFEGRLDALNQRFADHTIRLFERHGMTSVGYWVPQNPELVDNTLVYIISHESEEAVTTNWDAFRADPEWQAAAQASEEDGRIVSGVESVIMKATDYSMIR